MSVPFLCLFREYVINRIERLTHSPDHPLFFPCLLSWFHLAVSPPVLARFLFFGQKEHLAFLYPMLCLTEPPHLPAPGQWSALALDLRSHFGFDPVQIFQLRVI